MMVNNDSPPVLVEVTRGSLVESRHRGWIAVIDSTGRSLAACGDGSNRTFFRSAAKPFQAIPLITSGAAVRFGLTARELAVITGSHSGEEIHLAAVSSVLARGGLAAERLQCGAHAPFDGRAAKALRSAGAAPSVLHNNCSGKHAGMLLQAVQGSHPLEDYLAPDHPIQREMLRVVAGFTATAAAEVVIAVDGCSAPVFGVSLAAMALSYARLVDPPAGSEWGGAAREVVAAMIAHPEMVGGTAGRLDTDLMNALPGRIVSKVGAEGVQLLGLLPTSRHPHGIGIAIKIEDGDIRRARDPVVIEVLRQLGVIDAAALAQVDSYAQSTIRNHRQLVVGEVRPVFDLSAGCQLPPDEGSGGGE